MSWKLFTRGADQSRSDGLDALRFILALWVLFAHGVGWSIYTGALSSEYFLNKIHLVLIWVFQRNGQTHPAVLAFIVLSGYCIHRNGFRIDRSFSLKAFAIRRSFRILPVYFIASLLGVVLWFVNIGTDAAVTIALTGTQSITTWCLFVKITGLSSFIPSLHYCSFQGNAPLTTAMVEIWLYVSYGVVVWCVAHGFQQRSIFFGFIILWLGTIFYVQSNQEVHGWWHNGSVVSFALYWWLGTFFAEFEPKKKTVFVLRISSIAVFLVVIGELGSGLVQVELGKIGLATFFGIAIQWLDHSWRGTHLLTKAGQAGYDIYALHAPLMIFFLLNGVSLMLAVSLTLMASMLCHLVFESPLLELGKRLAGSAPDGEKSRRLTNG